MIGQMLGKIYLDHSLMIKINKYISCNSNSMENELSNNWCSAR